MWFATDGATKLFITSVASGTPGNVYTVTPSHASSPAETNATMTTAIAGGTGFTGQKGGSAVLNVPVPVGSPALGIALFGQGSMLARMVSAWFNVNVNQELWCLPVADPAAGQAAYGAILIATAPTASGTLTVYIAGQKVEIAVGSTNYVSTIATNLAAQINAQLDLPVTAVATAGSVALTCTWKGSTGNDITIVPNYLGVNGGQAYPQGLSLSITDMGFGTAEPDFTGAISAIQALPYNYFVVPYTDTGSLNAWNAEIGFSSGGRWAYSRAQYGLMFQAIRGAYDTLISWGMTVNSPVITAMAVETQSPSSIWEWSAAYGGLGALGYTAMPAQPLQNS